MFFNGNSNVQISLYGTEDVGSELRSSQGLSSLLSLCYELKSSKVRWLVQNTPIIYQGTEGVVLFCF